LLDLAKFQRDADEKQLRDAIDTVDKPAIAACLRRLGGQIPLDIVNKLADYFDPDIANPTGKRGRKKHKHLFVEQHAWCLTVIGFYYWLYENREIARAYLHRDEEAFLLADNGELFDADGNFAPQWKYPLSQGKRDAFQLPNGTEIEAFVCKEFGICSRAFSDLRKAYRK
jgi:hypothetical protein